MSTEISGAKPKLPDFSDYPLDYSEHCIVENVGDFKKEYDPSIGMSPEISGNISRQRGWSSKINAHHSTNKH